jgi:hypothetical protein
MTSFCRPCARREHPAAQHAARWGGLSGPRVAAARRGRAHQRGGQHKVPQQQRLAPAARVPGEVARAVLQVGPAEVVHVRPRLRARRPSCQYAACCGRGRCAGRLQQRALPGRPRAGTGCKRGHAGRHAAVEQPATRRAREPRAGPAHSKAGVVVRHKARQRAAAGGGPGGVAPVAARHPRAAARQRIPCVHDSTSGAPGARAPVCTRAPSAGFGRGAGTSRGQQRDKASPTQRPGCVHSLQPHQTGVTRSLRLSAAAGL